MLQIELVKTRLQALLDGNTVSGRLLLDRLRVIDESSRKTAAYCDSKYTPFYYHLGKILTPTSMMEIGFNLGLLSSCFLKSCKTVERYLGFQEKKDDFYSPRLALANLRDSHRGGEIEIYVGKPTDDEFTQKISPKTWDLVILNEEEGFDKHLFYLDSLWPCISEDGIIVSEYIQRHQPAGEAFAAFCESKNRKPVIFDTRYGTGLVQK